MGRSRQIDYPAARAGRREYALDSAGVLDLPSLMVPGSLRLRRTPLRTRPWALPSGLTVRGDLAISDPLFDALPPSLTVGGNLIVRGTAIRGLPADLDVGGVIDVSNTQLTSVPSDLRIQSSLILNGCIHLVELPGNLEIPGSLGLRGTAVRLPPGLNLERLDLRDYRLPRLPRGLVVRRLLRLGGSNVVGLPADLTAGMVSLGTAPIRKLPRGLRIRGLDLKGSSLTSLPADLRAELLVLTGSLVAELPTGLSLFMLDARNSRLRAVPERFACQFLNARGIPPLDWSLSDIGHLVDDTGRHRLSRPT